MVGMRARQAVVAGGSLQCRGVADWDSQSQLVGRFGQLPSNVGALPGSGRALPGKWASGPRPEMIYRSVGLGCEEAAEGAKIAMEGCFHRL